MPLPVTAAGQNFGVIIEKDENVLATLLEKAQSERGLSPTSFNTYKECSLKFYLRFIAGADAVGTAEQVAATLQQQTDAYRELSSSLAYEDAE